MCTHYREKAKTTEFFFSKNIIIIIYFFLSSLTIIDAEKQKLFWNISRFLYFDLLSLFNYL